MRICSASLEPNAEILTEKGNGIRRYSKIGRAETSVA